MIGRHRLLLSLCALCSCVQLLVRSFSPSPLHRTARVSHRSSRTHALNSDDSPVLYFNRLEEESWFDTLTLVAQALVFPDTALEAAKLSDRIDMAKTARRRREERILRSARTWVLTRMLQRDSQEYIQTVGFLQNRIPREELPNLQDIPIVPTSMPAVQVELSPVQGLVADCALPNTTYTESLLDRALLAIFRGLVQREIAWTSDLPGIGGLLDEGRHYMLSPEGTESNQHKFVKNVLAGKQL